MVTQGAGGGKAGLAGDQAGDGGCNGKPGGVRESVERVDAPK